MLGDQARCIFWRHVLHRFTRISLRYVWILAFWITFGMSCQLRDASIPKPRAKLPARNSNAPWLTGTALKASSDPIHRLHPWVKDGTWSRKLKQLNYWCSNLHDSSIPTGRQHRRVQVCHLSPAISHIDLDFPTHHLYWQHNMMATFYASGASSRGETTLTLCLIEAIFLFRSHQRTLQLKSTLGIRDIIPGKKLKVFFLKTLASCFLGFTLSILASYRGTYLRVHAFSPVIDKARLLERFVRPGNTAARSTDWCHG